MESELANEAAAIPARSKRCDHDEVTIARLAASVAESVRFAVKRRIAKLDATIAAGADEFSGGIENGSTDGNAAFGKSFARFRDGDGEKRGVIEI